MVPSWIHFVCATMGTLRPHLQILDSQIGWALPKTKVKKKFNKVKISVKIIANFGKKFKLLWNIFNWISILNWLYLQLSMYIKI